MTRQGKYLFSETREVAGEEKRDDLRRWDQKKVGRPMLSNEPR